MHCSHKLHADKNKQFIPLKNVGKVVKLKQNLLFLKKQLVACAYHNKLIIRNRSVEEY